MNREEKEEKFKELARKVGVKYIPENRNQIQIIQDNLVTAMYKLERLTGYQITADFPYMKFLIILEEIENDPEFKNLKKWDNQ